MFSLTITDHVFIAHSLKREVFGPAQNLHGATCVVEVEFRREGLDQNNTVLDIGLASKLLREALSEINYKNLDDLEDFKQEPTTIEFLSRHVHRLVSQRVSRFFKGWLKVTLRESPVAWASYEAEIV